MTATAAYDHLAKLVIVGDSGVGKTCLLSRYAKDEFTTEFIPTIGIEFQTKTEQIKDKKVKAQVWDTAGQERFRSIMKSVYRGAYAVIIVYDVTDRDSFDNVKSWMNDLRRDDIDEKKMILVGNKCDCVSDRVIDNQTAKEFADSQGMLYAESSAKTNEGVDDVFRMTLSRILEDGGGLGRQQASQTKNKTSTPSTSNKKNNQGSSSKSSKEDKPPYLVKLVLIGDQCTGKSCLLSSYTGETFKESYIATIGVDFHIKNIVLDGENVKLQIWDTAGQERFRAITSAYYRGGNGIILVYDVTDKETFDHIDFWMGEVRRYAPADVPVLLVGNKCDKAERAIEYDQAKEYADRSGFKYLEVSAKEGTNVDDLFLTITRMVEKERPIGYSRGAMSQPPEAMRAKRASAFCQIL